MEQRAHPGATEDVPLVDAQVLAQLLDVLDEVPRCVLFDAREPEGAQRPYHGAQNIIIGLNLAHGVDLPAPRWSKRMICKRRGIG